MEINTIILFHYKINIFFLDILYLKNIDRLPYIYQPFKGIIHPKTHIPKSENS